MFLLPTEKSNTKSNTFLVATVEVMTSYGIPLATFSSEVFPAM